MGFLHAVWVLGRPCQCWDWCFILEMICLYSFDNFFSTVFSVLFFFFFFLLAILLEKRLLYPQISSFIFPMAVSLKKFIFYFLGDFLNIIFRILLLVFLFLFCSHIFNLLELVLFWLFFRKWKFVLVSQMQFFLLFLWDNDEWFFVVVVVVIYFSVPYIVSVFLLFVLVSFMFKAFLQGLDLRVL